MRKAETAIERKNEKQNTPRSSTGGFGSGLSEEERRSLAADAARRKAAGAPRPRNAAPGTTGGSHAAPRSTGNGAVPPRNPGNGTVPPGNPNGAAPARRPAPGTARPAPEGGNAPAARPGGTAPARKAPAGKAPSSKKLAARRRRKKRFRALGVSLLVILILCAVGAAGLFVASSMVSSLDTIFPGVSVGGVELSNMTRSEAERVLSDMEQRYYEDYAVTVKLPQDFSLTVTKEDAGLELSSAAAADAAFAYGRSGDRFADLYTYVRSRWLDTKIDVPAASTRSFNEEAVRQMVHEKVLEVNDALLESEMRVGKYSVNVVKGAQAFRIDEDKICEVLFDAILQGDPTPIVYQAEVQTNEEMDLDALHEELTCEAVSSSYDPALGGGTPSQVGVTFDLKDAKARWAKAEYGETVAIPLIITEPEQTSEELNNMLFRDLLGEKTTSLAGSTTNRISNVAKACECLNTIVMQPGDSFDYNTCLGERTEANGWLPAPAYADGEVRDEYGGGICQVSSTLFVSTLLADLDVTARTCHYFPVGYLTAGMDATVSWGGPEFRFTNDRDYPIRLKAFVSDDQRSVTVQIWGTNVDGSYVKINYSGAMEVANDPSITDSQGNQVPTGARATIWCHVFSNDGTLIKGEDGGYHWFLSEYHYHTEDIQARAAQ